MDEETLQQLVAMGVIPEEQALLYKQMGIGQEQANAPLAQGTQINGHLYVAASPMEHMAVALQRAMGARGMKKAQAGLGDTFKRQTAGRSALAQAIERHYREQNPDPLGPYTGEAPQLIE